MSQRIRDPIHDLIVFNIDDEVDAAAWQILRQPEFQRLRRIRQLGVSEFVFPSASHTRFAHSVGVFHNARRLVGLIKSEIEEGHVEGEFDQVRAKESLMAALLHDIGHGPFSHAFEEARRSLLGPGQRFRDHEDFTAELIEREASQIPAILRGLGLDPSSVSEVFRSDNPRDMYDAIISSSFDADRLDYLERDRYMTGVGAGAIDITWLLDNVRAAKIDVSPPESADADPIYTHSFCLGYKARDAAEDFLLSRYRLYSNVYFHKTTRGFEQLVAAFFRLLVARIKEGLTLSGVDSGEALIRFLCSEDADLDTYLRLDDVSVMGVIHRLADSNDGDVSTVAGRIVRRERLLCVDVQNCFPTDVERQRRLKHRLNAQFREHLGTKVFFDTAKLSIYGEIGADDSRAQKRLMIRLPNGDLREITKLPDATIVSSASQRLFERYYFMDGADFNAARSSVDDIGR